MTERTSAQIAYEAWGEAHGWPAGFPAWASFPPQIQAKWKAVADAVLDDAAGMPDD